jgi:lipoprotein-anchoring transpeptidase ErfK/SrfK
MKRVGLLLLLLAGLALAVVVPAARTDSPPPTTTTAGTIAAGVTIAGVDVGGLTPDAATAAVQQAFASPLELDVGSTRVYVTPDLLGATAAVQKAVDRATTAAAGTQLPLAVSVDQSVATAFVAKLAKRFDRAPTDAKLYLRASRPLITPERPGRKLDQKRTVRDVVAALTAGTRDPILVAFKSVKAGLTRASFGPVIVIHRGLNRLYLYRGMRFWRVFGVATGQSAYPTPLGRFTIVVKWRNPWWYPPKSPWAQGQKPIPPGPGNPLGTRWMGLSAPGVGIHGTPDAGSIGYSVSHGCIRMHIADAEWLFVHVRIGTTVFIVPN